LAVLLAGVYGIGRRSLRRF